MAKYDNVVIVPIYRVDLNEAEYISLQQCSKIFKNEKICFVAPQHLKGKINFPFSYQEEFFDDAFFRDTVTYSNLLMSVDFYQRFYRYDYMLIYQLDAFAFFNRLDEFVSYNYDYIGACIPTYYWPFLRHRVGNGGFSLRKIKSCIKLLCSKEEILNSASIKLQVNIYNQIMTTEDMFFSYCGNQKDIDFILAPKCIAQDFSVEFEVDGRYGRLNDNLPFGCHRWYQAALDIWWPYIEKMGYTMSKSFKERCRTHSTVPIDYRLFNLLENPHYHTIIKSAFDNKVCNREIIIWGFGIRGMRLLSLLKVLGISPVFIMDSYYSRIKAEDNLVLLPPVYDEITKSDRLTIITPREKYDEILLQLDVNGVDVDKYCILYDDLIRWMTNYIGM